MVQQSPEELHRLCLLYCELLHLKGKHQVELMQILLKTPNKTTGKPPDKPAECWKQKRFSTRKDKKGVCCLVHLQVLITIGGEERPRVERKHHSVNLD